MLSLEEAVEKLVAAVRPLGTETAPIAELAGRILAERITAREALPRFDNSAMDGWAVRSADVPGASREMAVRLQIVGRVPAGEKMKGTIQSGQCARIFTGSPLPEEADAVVMQEDAREEGGSALIFDAVKAWENVRFRGEDVKEGATLGEPGQRASAALLALIAASGVAEARVFQIPRVAILATGNELREPGAPLAEGEIYESNRLMLGALVSTLGIRPWILPVVRDDLRETAEALRRAAEADAIITSGGVSVGEFDFVKEAIAAAGGSLDFWRVAIKPGKPFLFATVLGKPLFGLPGNPVSALATFWLMVRPALLRMAGAANLDAPASIGELAQDLSNPGDRRHFVRVAMSANGQVRASGPQASHRLGSLAVANGLLEMPPESHWTTGRRVSVLRLDL